MDDFGILFHKVLESLPMSHHWSIDVVLWCSCLWFCMRRKPLPPREWVGNNPSQIGDWVGINLPVRFRVAWQPGVAGRGREWSPTIMLGGSVNCRWGFNAEKNWDKGIQDNKGIKIAKKYDWSLIETELRSRFHFRQATVRYGKFIRCFYMHD